jgi:hypothetical protein
VYCCQVLQLLEGFEAHVEEGTLQGADGEGLGRGWEGLSCCCTTWCGCKFARLSCVSALLPAASWFVVAAGRWRGTLLLLLLLLLLACGRLNILLLLRLLLLLQGPRRWFALLLLVLCLGAAAAAAHSPPSNPTTWC